MSLAESVRADLRSLPDGLDGSALAALALAMADRIDSGRGSPSECGKVLIQSLEQLRSLAPPKRKKDALDDLAAKRAERRSQLAGRGAEAETSPGS